MGSLKLSSAASTPSTSGKAQLCTQALSPNNHTTNMSRFFQASDSSSESEDDEVYSEAEAEEEESEEDSNEEEEDEDDEGDDSDDSKVGAAKFLRDVSDEDESDDEEKATVVKSAKDKRFEELEGTVRLIENAEKIGDWNVISAGV